MLKQAGHIMFNMARHRCLCGLSLSGQGNMSCVKSCYDVDHVGRVRVRDKVSGSVEAEDGPGEEVVYTWV